MKKSWLILMLVLGASLARAQGPVVTNVRAFFQPSTKLVDIYFDLVLPATNTTLYSAWAIGSANGGLTWNVPCPSISGDTENLSASRTNNHLQWNAGADWANGFITNMHFRVLVWDGPSAKVPPPGMQYIPERSEMAGTAYYMDTYHVTWTLWDEVRQWALTNGYTDLPAGKKGSTGNAAHTNHPVTDVNWYDCVKWCNARSEKEGLEACYYTDASGTSVYRTGSIVLQADAFNWMDNGYRLPSEWEWEKAARGGLVGKEYPWGDGIDGSMANYWGSGDPYDNGTTPVGYYDGSQIPAGVDMANAYGLYDMAGNARQWTWNFYSGQSGDRVLRGGSWNDYTDNLRCGYRDVNYPGIRYVDIGFRCSRGLNLLLTGVSTTVGILVDTTSDTDGDGITSGRESNLYGTNPNLRDTDGDGLDDFTELSRKLDPLDAGNPGNTNMDWFVSQGYYPFHPVSVTVSNRDRSTILDIYYTMNDTNAATAEVRGFAAVDAASTVDFSAMYPMLTMVEGTDVNWGEGVSITGTNPIHVAWDAGVDVGESVQDLQIRILARTDSNLPLHFVTVPADTNGPAFQISRYQEGFSLDYLKQMLLWIRAGGESFDSPLFDIYYLKYGLVAYFPFNGTANDFGGNGYNGTANGVVLTQDRFGHSDSAYAFDGVDDWIDMTSHFIPPLYSNAARTTVAWIKSDVSHESNVLLAGGAQYARGGWGINLLIGNVPYLWGHYADIHSPAIDYEWHHHVGTYDGTTMKYYIDGVLIGSLVANLNTTDGKLVLGRSKPPTSAFYFNGKLDDVMIYDRALPGHEVSELYIRSLSYPLPSNLQTAELLSWLAERLGLRLATEQEKLRAMKAASSGAITRWPMYYVTNKTANAFGIETTDTNAWFFIKE